MERLLLLSVAFVTILFSSCIQDEPLNAEADILTCTINEDILKMDPIISNDRVIIVVNPSTDLTKQAPIFTLTDGATIFPENGTELDFTTSQHYVVTSEDGKWQKEYEVIFDVLELPTYFAFENYELEQRKDTIAGRYYIFYEKTGDLKQYVWASANESFAMTGVGKNPDQYPTSFYPKGKSGAALKLTTCSTGYFGNMVKMPLAAGNFFLGQYNAANAMRKPLEATWFGQPFGYVPVALKGYYKYQSGDVYKDKSGTIIPSYRDSCSIYAVFYEVSDEVKHLDGCNVFTSPAVVSVATLQQSVESREFIPFDIPFVMRPGKSVDLAKLKNGQYNITVVFSSSKNGDLFEGAVGSELVVDEVEIIHN